MPHSTKRIHPSLLLNQKNILQLPSHTVRPLPAVVESQMHCPLNNDRLIHPDAFEWHLINRHGSREEDKARSIQIN